MMEGFHPAEQEHREIKVVGITSDPVEVLEMVKATKDKTAEEMCEASKEVIVV